MSENTASTFARDRFQYDVFSVILALASEIGIKRVPRVSGVLFCDFANAVLEYLTGQTKKLGLLRDFFGFGNMEEKSNQLLKEAFEMFGQKLNLELREALMAGLEQHFQHYHGEKWYSSSFDTWFGFQAKPMDSTFSLSVEFVSAAIKAKVRIGQETLLHCEAIGELMTKYVEEDIKYIRTHYHW